MAEPPAGKLGIHICVSGTVGCGKTCLCAALAAFLRKRGFTVIVFAEEIDTWAPEAGEEICILENMYQRGGSRDYLNVQIVASSLLRRRDVQAARQKYDVVLEDRCMMESVGIFFPLVRGKLDKLDAAVLDLHQESISKDYKDPPYFFWIRTTAERSLLRIGERGRRGEDAIDFLFLDSLNIKYSEVMNGLKETRMVRELDGSKDKEDVLTEALDWIVRDDMLQESVFAKLGNEAEIFWWCTAQDGRFKTMMRRKEKKARENRAKRISEAFKKYGKADPEVDRAWGIGADTPAAAVAAFMPSPEDLEDVSSVDSILVVHQK